MTYRVFYNRSEDWPFVCSIDEGTQQTEQVVMAVFILPPAVASSHFSFEKPNDQSPVFWFDVTGELEIKDGIAYFS